MAKVYMTSDFQLGLNKHFSLALKRTNTSAQLLKLGTWRNKHFSLTSGEQTLQLSFWRNNTFAGSCRKNTLALLLKVF
ncbi:hypothetical protein RclHR1_02190001 [Rhizophagus clarus]|uniref:Uncharacterized protein n=1 Tax=Rhizophagus clarus TaxID=94130 RepID=A0A2Z6RMF7_9GLOM|nr:hypothetical protein RclHR1_02190001 [Rhizophagus clarus]